MDGEGVVNIDVVSSMQFGDVVALRDFAFVHRLAHSDAAQAVAHRGGGSLPTATIDAAAAMDAWGALMVDGDATLSQRRAMADWLQLHANLHVAEWLALGLGQAPDLSQVDFSKPNQFYAWMADHAFVHDQTNQTLGIQ